VCWRYTVHICGQFWSDDNTRHVLRYALVDVIHTLMCFDNRSCVSMKEKCDTYGTCECWSSMDYRHQSGCQNCDSWMRAVGLTIAQEMGLSQPTTSWQSIASIPSHWSAHASRRLSSMDAILWIATRHQPTVDELFLHIICRQTKDVLSVKVCSTSTEVTSGHRIILMLSITVGICSISGSVWFTLEFMSPCLLPGRLTAQQI
jgi:hypothetical protein